MTDILARPLAPSPDAVESAVGEETVLLHLVNGTYYGLDAVGTRIWKLIKDGVATPDICQQIVDDYGIDLPTVETDVRTFLSDLTAQDILVDA